MTETENKKGTGINRWIIVLLIALGVYLAGFYPPIKPHVQLPGEDLTGPLFPFLGQDFTITNTLVTAGVVYLLLILVAFLVSRSMGDEKTPSRGMAAVLEVIIDALYNLVESTAGRKWARTIFPWVATIILVVLTANMFKLLPINETIGLVHEVHEGEGYQKVTLIPGVLATIDKVDETAEAHGEEHLYGIIPFFRGPSTDLNFTASLAIITMIVVQIVGVKANGLGYFSKFLNFGPFLRIWNTKKLGPFDVILPFIDIFVGDLELIAEEAKIISIYFRLLGALFGGAILLGVIWPSSGCRSRSCGGRSGGIVSARSGRSRRASVRPAAARFFERS